MSDNTGTSHMIKVDIMDNGGTTSKHITKGNSSDKKVHGNAADKNRTIQRTATQSFSCKNTISAQTRITPTKEHRGSNKC